MPNSKLKKAFAVLIFGALLPLSSIACNSPTPDAAAPQPQSSAAQPAAEASATPEPIAIATPESTAMNATPEPTEPARSAYTANDSSVAIYELPPTPAPNEPEWIDGYPPTPAEPPTMLIVSESADGEAAAEGLVYSAQWLERDEAQFEFEDDDAELKDLMDEILLPPDSLGPDRLLRVMTGSRTRLIMVAGFDDINQAAGAEYDFDESEFWECTRSNANPCERINADGFTEYHRIPPAVLQHPYISVFAMWSVAPTLKDGKIAPSDLPSSVSANWLFHIADE